VNPDELRNEKDSDDEDTNYNKGNWTKFKGNIQGDSDEDQDEIKIDNGESEKNGNKEDKIGRVKTFILELVYVNRILRESVSTITSRLLGFDHHPREDRQSGSKMKVKSVQQLSDCLDYFRQTEKLEKDNSWYCNKCKDHVEATKKIELYTVPPVLIFCLQRFKSHNIYFKEKLEDKIIFPVENLDMSPHVLSVEQKAS
jgi:hypothetical protein